MLRTCIKGKIPTGQISSTSLPCCHQCCRSYRRRSPWMFNLGCTLTGGQLHPGCPEWNIKTPGVHCVHKTTNLDQGLLRDVPGHPSKEDLGRVGRVGTCSSCPDQVQEACKIFIEVWLWNNAHYKLIHSSTLKVMQFPMNTIEMLTHLTDQGCRSVEPCSYLQRLLSPSSGKVTFRTANRILKNTDSPKFLQNTNKSFSQNTDNWS